MSRLFFSRRAERQLQRLPGEVRVHLETHLENLALMLGSTLPVSQVLSRLEREEDGFVTQVEGIRVSFALDAVLRVLLVHGLEQTEESAKGVPRIHGAQPVT
jgi:mRNA-degrading endonuclease RelE of RelBE toxin-antitoxin system